MLCALGDLVEDVVVWVEHEPARGSDTPATVHRVRGGSAANVAAFAAAAGVQSRFVGRVGDDPLGRSLVTTLRGAGVDVRVEVGGRTGSIVVLVHPDGERTMLPDRAAATELPAVPGGSLDDVTVLHLPAYSLVVEPLGSAARAAAVAVRASGGLVAVDASSAAVLRSFGPARSLDALVAVRPAVLFANAEEAAVLGLRPGLLQGVDVIVKRGPAPLSVWFGDGRTSEVEVDEVAGARDTTGAGDALAAGFHAARLRGADLVPAVRAGVELAGRVLGGAGAVLG